MCDCLKRISESAEKKIKEGIEEQHKNGVEYTTNEPTGFVDNEAITLQGTRLIMNYYVPYYRRKTNGELETRVTQKKVAIFLNHCPFCGKAEKKLK